jgi:tetrahedral aminopeptidase
MNDDQFTYLQRIVETTGPSGYEWDAQRVWRDRVAEVAASVATDSLGNCFATYNPEGSPRVMIEAHVDEIGFIIKYIDESGYLYFSAIGGFDGSTLPGNRVRIMGKAGPVIGVIGRKPTHLLEEDERKRAPELKSMWIDIGARSREEAASLIDIGDAGGRHYGLERLQGSFLTSNSMDDRVGCYVVSEAFRQLAQAGTSAGVVAVSAVQEEIGLRGAVPASYTAHTPIGIAVDVTWTSDHPYAPATELGEVKVGGGAVISRGANSNPHVVTRLVAAARAAGVPYQVQADPRGTSTDESPMQLSREGMATGLVSIPTRYLHTASEVLCTEDIDACVAVIARFVQDLDDSVDFTP